MTEKYLEERFRHPNVTISADATIVPCASIRKGERHPVTFAPFPDHGRPLFVASTLGSRSSFTEIAGRLSKNESEKIDSVWQQLTTQFSLDGAITGSSAVLASRTEGKPDIHIFIIGNPYDDNSLRLYCHRGIFEGVPAIIQDARGRKKDADKIENQFRVEGQYEAPKSWNSRKRR
ncbi:hypothetical protein M1615_02950 [Patescibacteria group bacterium]|nr:hypothetical protein [Patescibacteria group bacterium]